MYFLQKKDKKGNKYQDNVTRIHVTLWNKFFNCRSYKSMLNKNYQEINSKALFAKANVLVEKEMCLFNILQTI